MVQRQPGEVQNGSSLTLNYRTSIKEIELLSKANPVKKENPEVK